MNQFFNEKHPWTLAKELVSTQSTDYSELFSIL